MYNEHQTIRLCEEQEAIDLKGAVVLETDNIHVVGLRQRRLFLRNRL